MKTHGVLTIRFEMPFNVRCGACEHMIAKGVRFNAEKRKVGNYYSTPILHHSTLLKIWILRHTKRCRLRIGCA